MTNMQFTTEEIEKRREALDAYFMGGPELDPEIEAQARVEGLARSIQVIMETATKSQEASDKAKAFAKAISTICWHLTTLDSDTLQAIAEQPEEMKAMLDENFAGRASSDAAIEDLTDGVVFEYEDTLREARYAEDASLLGHLGYFTLLNLTMELYDKLQWARGDAADWERRARNNR